MSLGKWFAVVGCLGIGAVIAVTAPGCTVTTGGDVGDGGFNFGDDDTDAGYDAGPLTDNSACAYCLYPACAGEYSVCATNGECTTILRCAVACAGNSICSDACFNQHPDGQAAYRLYASCDTVGECGSCASVCPTQRAAQTCPVVPVTGTDDAGNAIDAGPADSGVVTVIQDCMTCQTTQCASQYGACSSTTSACSIYNQCVVACQDQTCIDTCGSANVAGQTAATALGTCTSTTCATACGLANP